MSLIKEHRIFANYLIAALATLLSVSVSHAGEAVSRPVTIVNGVPLPTPKEAISRAVTVQNGIPAATINEAVSRAATVVNGVPPLAFTEAISRASTVVNGIPPLVFTEAISRASTVVNSVPPVIFIESISRAATVCNATGLADIDSNGSIDASDITAFVGVLLGTNSNVLQMERSDQNCDGLANGQDIQPFVKAILP